MIEPFSAARESFVPIVLPRNGGFNHMSLTRRSILKSGLAGVAALNTAFSLADEAPVPKRKNRVHQSVCRWCYPDISVDKLCEYGAHIGLSGVDLLQPDEY